MTPVVSVADLQRLHLHHLRHGAAGVAADLETMAGLCGVRVGELVASIEALAGGDQPEAAGWAQIVLPFVRTAIERGTLVCE